jgi:tRNA(Ile)-lysidine synthase
MSLVTRTTEFLRRNEVLGRGKTLLIAVSGGCDSTVLASVMGEIARRWSLNLVLAYVHHGLRPEADAEAVFVEELARSIDARYASRSIDVREAHALAQSSLQDVARRLRYEALESLRDAHEAEAVLLAHHADDQAETVLANFLRGAGVRGLAAMLPVHGTLVRPFLGETRDTLERWAREHDVRWCHDASNESDAYARNALRHNVIPAIRAHAAAAWPAVASDTARLFQSLDTFLEAHVARLAAACLRQTEDGVFLAVQPLIGYFEYEQLALLRHALFCVRGSAGQYDEVFSLRHLIDAPPGKRAVLRGGFHAFREKENIVIQPPASPREACDVSPDTRIRYGSAWFSIEGCERERITFHRDSAEEFIDLDRTGAALRLRPWTEHDSFTPLGSDAPTDVGPFLAAAGFPLRLRRSIPVLSGPRGIVWVCGVRLADGASITEGTVSTARLHYHHIARDP